MKNQEQDHDYIKDMVEHQKNQLNPGYYVGTGRIPPLVRAPGNALPLAIFTLIQAIGLAAFYFLAFFDSDIISKNSSLLSDFIVTTIFFIIAVLLSLWFSIICFRKAKLQRLRKKQLEALDLEDTDE